MPGEAYWKIELYSPGCAGEAGFVRPEYIYIAPYDGEPQYFLHNNAKSVSRHDAVVDRPFGADSGDLNLPTSYRPGDILRVDGAPYASLPHYCIIIEVGDDCCGIQCLYPEQGGGVGLGAFKHGHYFSEYLDACRYLSPLYGARVFEGNLPEEYAFMKQLSEKLRKDPDFGKTLFEAGTYLL